MKFEDTGLKDSPVVRKAFEFAEAQIAAVLTISDKKKQAIIDREAANLNHDVETGRLPPQAVQQLGLRPGMSPAERLETIRSFLQEQVDAQLEMQQNVARQQAWSRVVYPARALQDNATKPSDDLVAAALAYGILRSPLDVKKLETAAGEKVAALASEVIDVQAYPELGEEKVRNASKGARQIMLATHIGDMQSLLSGPAPRGMVMVPVRAMVDFANTVRGADKKMDDSFVDCLNKVCGKFNLGYKVEVGADSVLKLIDPPPGFNPGAGGIGGVPPLKGPGGPGRGGNGGGGGWVGEKLF